MKKAFLTAACAACCVAVFGQSSRNLTVINQLMEQRWKHQKPDQKHEEENADNGGYQQFERWKNFWKQRTYPSYNLPNPEILYNEYTAYKQSHKKYFTNNRSSTWQTMGPTQVPSNGGGAGRINVMRFQPGNPSVMYVGTAGGGIWKTTNGGNSWTALNDFLPSLSVADIAINPIHTDTVYAATGDGYGYEAGGLSIFWGGTYSDGIMMSADGGTTWQPTGLGYAQTNSEIIQRLLIDPVHPNILIAATRTGIYRSANGAQTWVQTAAMHVDDMEFNTANHNVIYTSDGNDVYSSTNNGVTWNVLASGVFNGGRVSLAVTPASAQVIYGMDESGVFMKSNDGGVTWNWTGASPTDQTTLYGYYDDVLEVSPTNENHVYAGGLEVVQSTDGGVSWNLTSSWTGGNDYVHADNHFIAFAPGSNTTVFSCNDGGIFKTTDNGNTWTDKSNGLSIGQFYRIGCAATNANILYAGQQDNGTSRCTGTTWQSVAGGDGMECLVDRTDVNHVIASYQYGALTESTDGGQTFNDISASPTGGDWTSPFVQDPQNAQTYYGGFEQVYQSTDGGWTWIPITNMFTDNVLALSVAPNNHNYIYASSYSKFYMSSDGGNAWTDISNGLTMDTTGLITYIAVSDANPHTLWVTRSGYSAGQKVFMSTNGGASWTNVSGTLPNVPVNCIARQNNSNDLLYIGTDFGVFYKDNSMSDWQPYGSGLPNVMVEELEIHYGASKLRAATYGRGIWQTDLAQTTLLNNDIGAFAVVSPAGSSCDATFTPQVTVKNFGVNTINNFVLHYRLDNQATQTYNWTGTLTTTNTVSIPLPSITVSFGTHHFYAYTTSPNNTTDALGLNDSTQSQFTSIQVLPSTLPVADGFENGGLANGWTLMNASNLWLFSPNAGGFGNTTRSAYANCYNVSSGTDYIQLPVLNLSTMAQGILTLSFNHAYAPYDNNGTYDDKLRVTASTDCGTTYQTIWQAADVDSLGTTAENQNEFVPTSSEWRHHNLDLSSFIGSNGLSLRFEVESHYGNDIYLDDVNLAFINTGIAQPTNAVSVNVYPNPTRDIVTVNTHAKLIGTWQVTDVLGRTVASEQPINATQWHMQTSAWSPGIYLLKMVTDNGVRIVQRFCVQR